MEALKTLVPVFGVFIPALLLPGPDFIGVVRSAVTRGTTGGLRTTVGVSVGLGLYATLSLLGLSAVLVEYQWLTWAVRLLGGAYLAYLGFGMILAKRADHAEMAMQPLVTGNAFVFGFLVTLTNPKAIVLFASVFATSVTSRTPSWLMALMIGLVVLSALIWYSIVTLFMSAPAVMRRLQHASHWIERVAGVCFVAIGLRILADARNPVAP